MNTVAQILQDKPDQIVYTMESSASVLDGARLMGEKNIGALVVVDGGRVVGLVAEREYTRRLVLAARSPAQTRLGDIMSQPVMYVRPNQTSEECMALMTRHRLRHLPVMDGDKLVGLVSIGDMVKATIDEQKFIIEQLEHYIAGHRG